MSKETPILVSTDVGARGLDSAHADLVINIELANQHEVMTHRMGRGGRFGTGGECIFISATDAEQEKIRAFGKEIDIKLGMYENAENLIENVNRNLNRSKNRLAKEKEVTKLENEPETSEVNVGEKIVSDLIEADLAKELQTFSSQSDFEEHSDSQKCSSAFEIVGSNGPITMRVWK